MDTIPVIAKWYYDEWGHLRHGNSLARTREEIEGFVYRDRMPFIRVATLNNAIVGAAQLKFHEMAKMFPDKEHWLGGVYVAADSRGRGYGSLIAEDIARLAPEYGVQTLYLQTPALDGGIYAQLGWVPYAQVNNHGLDVLVMERHL
jgi:GNAT superfamily N-acetyltransferase